MLALAVREAGFEVVAAGSGSGLLTWSAKSCGSTSCDDVTRVHDVAGINDPALEIPGDAEADISHVPRPQHARELASCALALEFRALYLSRPFELGGTGRRRRDRGLARGEEQRKQEEREQCAQDLHCTGDFQPGGGRHGNSSSHPFTYV